MLLVETYKYTGCIMQLYFKVNGYTFKGDYSDDSIFLPFQSGATLKTEFTARGCIFFRFRVAPS